MSTTFFIIPGQPVSWKRARVCGKRFFREAKQARHQGAIVNAWYEAGAISFGSAPLRVEILFFFEKPKSNKTRFPTHRNDADNLAKEVLDALNAHAFDDDGQVVELFVRKEWSEKGGAGTQVRISVL